jgi:hypothetical protein
MVYKNRVNQGLAYVESFVEEEFHKAFDELLGTLNITEPFYLVVQVQTWNFSENPCHRSLRIYGLNHFLHFLVGIYCRFLWSNMGIEEPEQTS